MPILPPVLLAPAVDPDFSHRSVHSPRERRGEGRLLPILLDGMDRRDVWSLLYENAPGLE